MGRDCGNVRDREFLPQFIGKEVKCVGVLLTCQVVSEHGPDALVLGSLRIPNELGGSSLPSAVLAPRLLEMVASRLEAASLNDFGHVRISVEVRSLVEVLVRGNFFKNVSCHGLSFSGHSFLRP